jgi:hypothetical protein
MATGSRLENSNHPGLAGGARREDTAKRREKSEKEGKKENEEANTGDNAENI